MGSSSSLTLGPSLFNWPVERWRDFYFRIADEADVDTVCIGEVVCSKRTPFFTPHMPEVMARLAAAGKTVVVSSLALIMSERELEEARQIAGTDWLIEANDLSVVSLLAGKPFVLGPLLNIYNEGTLAYLKSMGAVRACLPAEISLPVIQTLTASAGCEIEVQAFGRLPLALSARCYHARSRNLAKDGCQYVCAEDLDGMAVETLDDQSFLAVNGTQTMSFHYLDALESLGNMQGFGVRHFRLWPQTADMVAIAALFRSVLKGSLDPKTASVRLREACPRAEFANGYLFGREGCRMVEVDE